MLYIPNISYDSVSHAAPTQSDYALILEMSRTVSSISTNISNIEKNLNDVKSDIGDFKKSVSDLLPKVSSIEEWKGQIEKRTEGFYSQTARDNSIKIKALEDKFGNFDISNAKTNTTFSNVVSVLLFIATILATMIITRFFPHKKEENPTKTTKVK